MKSNGRVRWVALLVALVIGTTVGVSAARALVETPRVSSQSLSLPALDGLVTRLAAEARASSSTALR